MLPRTRLIVTLVVALTFSTVAAAPSQALVSAVRMGKVQTTVYETQTVLLRGTVARSLRGRTVRIEYRKGTSWVKLASTRSVRSSGYWRVKVRVPKGLTTFKVRAVVGLRKSPSAASAVLKAAPITAQGPGGYLMGLDVSRWQHGTATAWDYATMAANGAAFLMIKASDGTPKYDALAVPWALIDSAGAKAAGIYVGYYHYAQLPVGADGKPETDASLIIADAKAQATLAAGRLEQLGGYDGQTLPYTLDIEEHYLKWTDPLTGTQSYKYWTKENVSLWTRAWYNEMVLQTKRKPIIYSYRSFMASNFDFATNLDTRNTLQSMHLWLAQPGHPEDKTTIVGAKGSAGDCYVMAWTLSGCKLVWTFWQYTNSGDRERFGIPWSPASSGTCTVDVKYCEASGAGSRNSLDVNVFSGSVGDLTALAAGTWDRSPVEFQ